MHISHRRLFLYMNVVDLSCQTSMYPIGVNASSLKVPPSLPIV